MSQKTHVIHGRDHEHSGADPICIYWEDVGAGGSDYPTLITGYPNLRAYWRLGESVSPFADTAGYGTAATLNTNPGTTGSPAMSTDITPGLLTTNDDGAVRFNAEGNESPSTTGPLPYLEEPAGHSLTNLDFSGTHAFSVVARVKPTAATNTFWGGVVSLVERHDGPPAWMGGWILHVRFPTLQAEFFRGSGSGSQVGATSPTGALSAGVAHTLAGTYDGTTIRLYVDGALAASVADSSSLPAPATGWPVQIGGYDYAIAGTGYNWRPFLGVVDEVAVYGGVLSAADISALHGAA